MKTSQTLIVFLLPILLAAQGGDQTTTENLSKAYSVRGADLAPRQTSGYSLMGWNNLGMHCMDADYSVLSLLPPYNTIHTQLIDPSGRLVTDATGFTVTYQAIADSNGAINTTSVGKSNFWEHVKALFGVSLPPDTGLPVPGPNSYVMPGTSNVPQAMSFESGSKWFAAYGIPITPRDDTMNGNAYPMMRVTASQAGSVVAMADIVLPVSDEMDCRACHASGSGPAAQPIAGWVNDPDPQRDYRLNVLRLHDDRQAADPVFQAALATKGYNASGLYPTVATNGIAILCAACHLSEALPGSGIKGVKPLTQASHSRHATVVDPTNGLTLDADGNRSACYRCHPGSTTRCLRGVMGKAVAADGSMRMQCQSCHGSMSAVGSSTRTGWLMEPNCQACHTGDAVSNNGQIRFTSVFDTPGHMRVAVDRTFATNPDTPAAGLSLFRFSVGHGGLKCEACHGSTHAEFPTTHPNDNITSMQHQGHVGMLAECDSCHGSQPSTVNGGPHGLHPLGQGWVRAHHDLIESSGAAQCQSCHGADYRGTVLSRSQADRTISAFDTKSFWRGFQIGCYTCHNGPGSEDPTANHPAVANNASVATGVNTPVAIALQATDSDRNPLTLRIVSQTTHGTVGLVGTAATYYPDKDYVGGDSFTFAAWDGSTDSNLATVLITVGADCTYTITPTSASFSSFQGSGTVNVDTSKDCPWTASSNAPWLSITSGTSGTGPGTVQYSVAANTSAGSRTGTMTVATHTFTVSQAGLSFDVTGAWLNLTQTTKGSGVKLRAHLKGKFVITNGGKTTVPKSVLAFYVSDNPTVDQTSKLLKKNNVSQLKAGKYKTITLSVNLPKGTSASGKYIVAADDKLALAVPSSQIP